MKRRQALALAAVAVVSVVLFLLTREDGASSTLPPPATTNPPRAESGPVVALAPAPAPTPTSRPAHSGTDPVDPPQTRLPAGGKTSLSGVTGRVIDAATGQPIAGAWVTWRRPEQETLLSVLADPARYAKRFAGPSHGAISGAKGVFSLERLDDSKTPSALLFAVAEGYGCALVRPRLSRTLTIELQQTGSLVVEVEAPTSKTDPIPHVRALAPSAPDYQERFLDLMHPDSQGPGLVYTFPTLQPGPYDVSVPGQAPERVTVGPGPPRHVRLGAPELWNVKATIPADLEAERFTLREQTQRRLRVTVWPVDGRIEARIPPGRWAVFAHSNGRSLRLDPLVEGAGEYALKSVATQPVELQFTRDGEPWTGAVSLVGVGSLVGEVVALEPDPDGRCADRVPPGNYAVVCEGRFVDAVSVPTVGPLVLDLRERHLDIRWAVPETLKPGEAVRGRVAVVHARRAEDDLTGWERVLIGPGSPALHRHGVLASGRYTVVLETDLGVTRTTVDVGDGAVTSVVVDPARP